jgi:hypothetical protein
MENKEKRMIGEYTVINSIHIVDKEIVLAENANAKDERYMCCYVKSNGITDICSEALAGEHYAEILHIYGVRIKEASEVLIEEAEEFYDTYGSNEEITKDDCKVINYGDDYLENKIIVIKGDVLYPEHRKATKQLYLCTGGFGSRPKSRGTAVFCTSLFDGHSTRFERPDVLGIMEPDNLPRWAKDGLKKVKGEN